MVQVIKVDPILTDEQADELAGTLLGPDDFARLIKSDADVYCKQTGQLLAKFRKAIIPQKFVFDAHNSLRTAATPTSNRGISAGKINGEKTRFQEIKKDGTLSNTNRAKPINSGIIGYFDRNPRFPYCRTTAFTEKQFSKFKKAYPIIKFVSDAFKELVPDRYAAQEEMVKKTKQGFFIKGTVFTTVTVNLNWQTAVHKDQGDLKEGFGNLVALRKGKYEGGYFVLPKWGVAFDIQNQDVLFVDVHQWHGNTPITKVQENAERISLVMYYREKMVECGTLEEELQRSKTLRS